MTAANKCPHVDLMNPDTFIGGPPREFFKALRADSPVYWHEEDTPEGGFWAITKKKDLDFVSKNPLLFSSWEKTPYVADSKPDRLEMNRTQMICMDPPEHLKYRRIVRNGFTPRKVDSYTERFEQIARDILDRAVQGGECEFVEDIAAELPLIAICELIGIPLENRKQLFEWTNIMLGIDDPDLATSEQSGFLAVMGVYEYGKKIAAEHRENPKDDIVNTLLSGSVDGEALTEDEFCNFFLLLLVAGNETTRTVTSQTMRLLIETGQYQQLVDDPSLLEHAIEEALRYNPAVTTFRRTAMEDVKVGDQMIKKADKVMLYYASANADEELFEDPDKFDITRPLREDVRNNHRSFGIGEHFCLGSHLARLELRVIFSEILKRIRNPQLNGDINWLRSNFINGIKKMPIKFDVV